MATYFLDFETYYDRQFSLRKLTPPEYILGDQFAVHGLAVAYENEKPVWLDPANCVRFFTRLKMRQGAGERDRIVTFNALFDMAIVAWRYRYVPFQMVDVLGMARAQLKHLNRHDLGHVAESLGLGSKGDALADTMGKSTGEIIADRPLYNRFKQYAIQDVELTRSIFNDLSEVFPGSEYAVMDLVLRAAIEPQFKLDKKRLSQHLIKTRHEKDQLLARCGATKSELMSAEKFKAILEAQGVTVPTKPSPSGGDPIPALAKTDSFLQSLTEHPNPHVATLAEARLGHKSTLEETRTERLIKIGNVMSWAPVPLKYGAALTHRLGGDWKINLQNMPRGSELRNCLVAPSGRVVIAADMEQIEARMVAWLAGCKKLVKQFAEDQDPYSRLGEAIFNLEVGSVSKANNPVVRFIGKTGILGLGYGAASWPTEQFPTGKFHWMVHNLAKLQLGRDIDFSEAAAKRTVKIYREDQFPEIPALWSKIGEKIPVLKEGLRVESIGPVQFEKGQIVGPNGLTLQYPNIRSEWQGTEDDEHARRRDFYGDRRQSIYGAKLLENIIQFLSRCLIMDAAVTLNNCYGLRFALQAHDELVFVVEEDMAEQTVSNIKQVMTSVPPWARGLPLSVAISKPSKSYGAAK